MSELSPLLFGKTGKVKLADGIERIIREPNIEALEKVSFDLAKLDDLKNVKKLTWLMLKEDNPDLSEERVGKLITFSMLSEKSDFLKSVFGLLGSGDSKNEQGAGETI